MKIANFTNWQILEHFGTGEETFTQKLDYQTGNRNLDIWGPMGWGDVENATGKMTYTAKLDYTKGGIEDVHFAVQRIELTITTRTYQNEKDDDGVEKDFDIVLEGKVLETCKVEVNGLPFYVTNLEIDLRETEDIDGEVDLNKAKLTLTVGSSE